MPTNLSLINIKDVFFDSIIKRHRWRKNLPDGGVKPGHFQNVVLALYFS